MTKKKKGPKILERVKRQKRKALEEALEDTPPYSSEHRHKNLLKEEVTERMMTER